MSAPMSMRCPTCDARFASGSCFCATDGARLVEAPITDGDPLIDTIVAERYRLTRLIGQGGMGRVYEAQHVNINKRLAIKMLLPEAMADPEASARFRREARSVSAIGHENIIAVDDSATLADGTVYLAMEFLEGESLGARMRRAPSLSFVEAAKIMVPVCRGLAAAHAAGIVHRDVKPENIFLAERRETSRSLRVDSGAARQSSIVPKILDFGIAKASTADGSTHLTRTGAIFGTPTYMSPEQADARPLDHRADIYSTGVILYELFAGRVPFKANSLVQVLHQHIAMAPPLPSVVAPERHIPPAVEALILRALEKDPAARQHSIDVLGDELERAMGDLVETPPALAQVPPQPRPPQRSLPPPSAAVAAVATLPPPSVPPPRETIPVEPLLPVSSTPSLALRLGLLTVLLLAIALVAALVIHPSRPAVPAPAPVLAIAPPTVTTEDVIITSIPAFASVLVDGAKVGETPDVIKVAAGHPVQVVVHKDGFVDQTLTVDSGSGHKLIVKLDKKGGSVNGAPAAARPTPASHGSHASTPVAAPARPVTPVAAAPAPQAVAPVVLAKIDPPPVKETVKERAPSDALSAALDRLAAGAAPGARRIGSPWAGAGEDGEHGDWNPNFTAGKCYDIAVKGGEGVERIYLYLWGPTGRRVADRQEGSPDVVLHHCAATTGTYHIQAKVADGKGSYRVAVYAR